MIMELIDYDLQGVYLGHKMIMINDITSCAENASTDSSYHHRVTSLLTKVMTET